MNDWFDDYLNTELPDEGDQDTREDEFDFFEPDEDDWDEYEEDDLPRCGCQFCYCGNTTTAGETCNECLAGSHQG